MKLMKWILLALLITTSPAKALTGLNQNTLKIINICDSLITTTNVSCDTYNTSSLTSLADGLLGPEESWECEQNPNDPSCDSSPALDGAYEIHFFVIDANNEQANYFVANRSPFGSVTLTQTAISSTDQAIANDIYSLENELAIAATKYSFNQNGDGSFANSFNQTLSSLSDVAFTSNSTSTAAPDSCQSAIAYSNVQDCASLINGMIRTQNDGEGSTMGFIFEITSRINVAVGAGGFHFHNTRRMPILMA